LTTSKPPSSISVEELTADEDFDISFVTAIETTILVHLQQKHIHERYIIQILEVLRLGAHQLVDLKSSQILYQSRVNSDFIRSLSPIEISRSMSPPQCSTPSSPPEESMLEDTHRERFAISCVSTLFNVCSNHNRSF
jgi:hypothetical protein